MTYQEPLDALDQGARSAFRRSCDRLGGRHAVVDVLGLGQRAGERLYGGKRRIPPGIALTIARYLRGIDPTQQLPRDAADAAALEAWADSCNPESAQ